MNLPEPVETFRAEAQDLLEQIEQDLLDLARAPADKELVARVFRALHTLKGSGAMFGFDALAGFTHHCESAFDQVRKGEVAATPQLVAAVLRALDHMRALAEERTTAPGAGEALLAGLHHELLAAGPATANQSQSAASQTWHIRFSLAANVLVNGTRPLPLLDELRAMGECQIRAITDAIPPLEALVPTECYLGWDMTLTTDQPRSAIEDVFMFVIEDMTLCIEAAGGNAAASPAAEGSAPASSSEAKPLSRTADDDAEPTRTDATTRVPAGRLDELMDRVGELVIAQSRLKQIASHSIDMNLRAVSEEIEQLAAGLRDSMMSVRMVPVAQLFSRFRRLIHDLARNTGKEIELVTEGEATELDKTVLERLADPLVHLIRNAADHGLELPEERLAAGKPSTGRLKLAARQAGAEVVITVEDDGRGINRSRVRAKAEESGLLAPDAIVTDAELLQMIFQPGFSTAAQITDLSGRGVGMDVVKRTIESLRGTLELSSPPGKGSSVALRIPLTLAIIDGLLVRVGTGRYVIPLSAVEECQELPIQHDLRSTGRSFLTMRGQLVPFIRLREMFATRTAADRYQKIVVVSAGRDRVGLVVDQILGNYQTVIKPLSVFHSEIGMFSGATILGDGSVALILDVSFLTTAASSQAASPMRAAS